MATYYECESCGASCGFGSDETRLTKTTSSFAFVEGQYYTKFQTFTDCIVCGKFSILIKKTMEKANFSQMYNNSQNDLATKMKYI